MTKANETDFNEPARILRLPAVRARTGLARSTIYLRMSEGRFPKPISLGPRAVGWIETEVDTWLQRQIETSRSEPEAPMRTRGNTRFPFQQARRRR